METSCRGTMKATAIRSYKIPHEGEGSLHLFGAAEAVELVIMCPGFPDDHRSFTPLARRFAKESHCLVGVMCLPGFEDAGDTNNFNIHRAADGYSFSDWVSCVREAIKTLLQYSSQPRSTIRLTGIFHDWGVMAGLQYANQVLEEGATELSLDQLVILDVLPMPHPTTSMDTQTTTTPWIERFSIATYQWALATNFWLYLHPPRWLVFVFMYLTEKTLTATKLFPVSTEDYQYLHTIDILPVQLHTCLRFAYMCYPYRNVRRLGRTIFDLTTLPPIGTQPVLFLYGRAKWVPLHHRASLELLSSGRHHARSRVVRVEPAGHWLHRTHEEECFAEMQRFIEES